MKFLLLSRVLVLSAVSLLGCGDDDDAAGGGQGGSAGSSAGQGGSSSGGSGQGGAGGCATADCAPFKTPAGKGTVPPASGGGAAEGSESVQAISRLFVGESDRQGAASADAWKAYGFDLDGWSSTPEQEFHCKPRENGSASRIRTDGADGIDNSFGRGVVPILAGFGNVGLSQIALQNIQKGQSTTLLDVTALGAASSYASLTGSWVPALGDGPVAPADWSTYAWRPVTGKSAAAGSSYLTSNVLVFTFAQPVTLSLPILVDSAMALPLRAARLSVDLGDRKGGKSGSLGGIVDTEELITALKDVVTTISTDFCGSTATFDSIAQQIRQESDIMVDGTQDPAKTCDGISLGIGFETTASSKGAEAAAPVVVDPCPQE